MDEIDDRTLNATVGQVIKHTQANIDGMQDVIPWAEKPELSRARIAQLKLDLEVLEKYPPETRYGDALESEAAKRNKERG